MLPIIIKVFAVVGTIALLLVSGGIFVHKIEFLHHLFPKWPDIIKEFTFGVIGGIVVLAFVSFAKIFLSLFKKKNV
jgi:predicted DNA repair protein MutK